MGFQADVFACWWICNSVTIVLNDLEKDLTLNHCWVWAAKSCLFYLGDWLTAPPFYSVFHVESTQFSVALPEGQDSSKSPSVMWHGRKRLTQRRYMGKAKALSSLRPGHSPSVEATTALPPPLGLWECEVEQTVKGPRGVRGVPLWPVPGIEVGTA